jgi:hypothetical protein
MFIQLELDFGPGSIVEKDCESELMVVYFDFLERIGPSPRVPRLEKSFKCPECHSLTWLA